MLATLPGPALSPPDQYRLLSPGELVSRGMKSPKPQEWSDVEVEQLISMTARKISAEEIAMKLGRYVGSVKKKARNLGLAPIKKKRAT
jgi:hypothetical protein